VFISFIRRISRAAAELEAVGHHIGGFSVGNTELVLELLESRSPQPLCDDCISAATGIEPRQQVNQITRRLSDRGLTRRDQLTCVECRRSKKCSVLLETSPDVVPARVAEPPVASVAAPARAMPPTPPINEMRDHIVRFCRGIAARSLPEAKEYGPTRLITALRDADYLPAHQANMMLTLCALRNSYSYDKISLGPREMAVAEAAWAIVKDWALTNHDATWRLTAR
jgi:hypothetical protein